MASQLIELVLDESKWLTASMLAAVLAVGRLVVRRRPTGALRRPEVLGLMNLFYGCTIGVMSLGHLLAVTVKVSQGTLDGSPWVLYPLGLVLLVPSTWLALRSGRFVEDGVHRGRRTVALNAWLGVALLALGLHNWPLALPAALNVAYQLHSRRNVGRAIVAAAIAANLLLFIGSLVFLASGQSFEQFEDM